MLPQLLLVDREDERVECRYGSRENTARLLRGSADAAIRFDDLCQLLEVRAVVLRAKLGPKQ